VRHGNVLLQHLTLQESIEFTKAIAATGSSTAAGGAQGADVAGPPGERSELQGLAQRVLVVAEEMRLLICGRLDRRCNTLNSANSVLKNAAGLRMNGEAMKRLVGLNHAATGLKHMDEVWLQQLQQMVLSALDAVGPTPSPGYVAVADGASNPTASNDTVSTDCISDGEKSSRSSENLVSGEEKGTACLIQAGTLPQVAWADLAAGDSEVDVLEQDKSDLVVGRARDHGLAEARCTATVSTLPCCAPRRSGWRRRATALQVQTAMLAAGEQIPRLVCILAHDESEGKKLLGDLISDLVEARVPSALRRDFAAQASGAAQSPADLLFYSRMLDDSGEDAEDSASAHEDLPSDDGVCDDRREHHCVPLDAFCPGD